jgi:hypothetical protein
MSIKIACHQPYLFPYRGYFDLIASVDKFIIGDDYQYIKGGYINRNYFPDLFTFRLEKHSNYNKINEIYFKDIKADKERFLRKTKLNVEEYLRPMQQSYCLSYNIALTLRKICDKLGIRTPFYFSSTIPHRKFANGIVDMVKALGGDTYINAPGGRKLYNQEMFGDIKLEFIDTKKGPSILCEI